MRERAEARRSVLLPRTHHANQGRRRLQTITIVGMIAVGVAGAYQYLNKKTPSAMLPAPALPTQPPMLAAPTLPMQPALSAPSVEQAALEPAASPIQEFPASGTTQWYRETNQLQQTGVLRIMDTSDLRGNKVVRIRDAFGTPVAQTYIRFEEGAQLLLPLGRYEMTIASGDAWYGPDKQFGAGATYFRTSGADVIAGEVNYRILPSNQGGRPMAPIQSDAF